MDAEVVIVEFGDYECPFCNAAEPVLRFFRNANPDRLALVYRHYPISYHAHAYRTARIAECAADQGRFEPAHEFLYDAEDLAALEVVDVLRGVSIPDSAEFMACATRGDVLDRVEDDRAVADGLGVTGTPTFIVNGVLVSPTPDSASLRGVIESALARAAAAR